MADSDPMVTLTHGLVEREAGVRYFLATGVTETASASL